LYRLGFIDFNKNISCAIAHIVVLVLFTSSVSIRRRRNSRVVAFCLTTAKRKRKSETQKRNTEIDHIGHRIFAFTFTFYILYFYFVVLSFSFAICPPTQHNRENANHSAQREPSASFGRLNFLLRIATNDGHWFFQRPPHAICLGTPLRQSSARRRLSPPRIGRIRKQCV
jgi:hypothetical protein